MANNERSTGNGDLCEPAHRMAVYELADRLRRGDEHLPRELVERALWVLLTESDMLLTITPVNGVLPEIPGLRDRQDIIGDLRHEVGALQSEIGQLRSRVAELTAALNAADLTKAIVRSILPDITKTVQDELVRAIRATAGTTEPAQNSPY